MPNIVTSVIDVVVSLEQIGGGELRVNATLGENEDGQTTTATKYKLITPLKEGSGHPVEPISLARHILEDGRYRNSGGGALHAVPVVTGSEGTQ